jgi:hypothetical protein
MSLALPKWEDARRILSCALAVAAVKILLPAMGMAGYTSGWRSVAFTGREPNDESRFKEPK